MLIGPAWPPSGEPYVFVAKDGREVTLEIHQSGALLSEQGGVTQFAHYREPENQEEIDAYGADAVRIGERWFRPIAS